MYVGLAVGATAILVPEEPIDFDKDVIEKIRAACFNGLTHYMIVVTEGTGSASDIGAKIIRSMKMVKKQTLLLIAGTVWSVAGMNILRIGIVSCIQTSITFTRLILFFVGIYGIWRYVYPYCKKAQEEDLGVSGKHTAFLEIFQYSVLCFNVLHDGVGCGA